MKIKEFLKFYLALEIFVVCASCSAFAEVGDGKLKLQSAKSQTAYELKVADDSRVLVKPKVAKPKIIAPKKEYIVNSKLKSNDNLNKYIKSSLDNSPDIKEREANLEESQYLYKQSYLGVLPSVTARAGIGSQYFGSPAVKSRKFGAEDVSVDIHQNIFGEGNLTEVKISRSVLNSKAKELEQIQNLITLSTVEAYLNIIRYELIADIQKESIESHQSILAKTRLRLKAGLMRASDLYLTEARTISSRSNLTTTNSQLQRSKNLLFRYSQIDLEGKLIDIDVPHNLPKDFDSAWSDVMEHNPIIKAKYHEIKTSDYSRKKDLLTLYPSVSVDLSASKTYDNAGIQGINQDLSAMLNMKYDFNFGSNYYRNFAAKSRLKLRRYEYKKSQSDIYQNLSSLYSDYKEVNDRIIFLKGNRDFLAKVVDKHNKEFTAGFRGLFDLLNTKSEFFNADIQYINAVYDGKILAYTILANTGKLLTYFDH
jgi:adhesin transport system outer membrane protein